MTGAKAKSSEKHTRSDAEKTHQGGSSSRGVAPPQPANGLLGFQQAAGNLAVQRLMRDRTIQAQALSGPITPPVQRQVDEEEEEIVQRQVGEEEEEEEAVQRKAAPVQGQFSHGSTTSPRRSGGGEAGNHTGMPNRLKTRLESLSGMDLSGVRVQYNSPKPASINALAYTQGQDIHVGPGQEKHLPHEGWHVVQQMQGRVKPTIQAKGVSINDDEELEREADVMGAKALQMKRAEQAMTTSGHQGAASLQRKVGTKGESEVQTKPRSGNKRQSRRKRTPKLDDKTFHLMLSKIAKILAYAPSPPAYVDLPGTGPKPDMADVPDYFQPALWDFWEAANGHARAAPFKNISGKLRRERVRRGWRRIQVLLRYARSDWVKGEPRDWVEKWNKWFFDNVHLKVIHIEVLAGREEAYEEAQLQKKAELEKSIPTIGGWKLLGTESFKWGSQKKVIHYYVGTEEQWREVLQKADDKDVYYTYVNGFLQLVNNPDMVGRTRKRMATQYKNTIKRAPTHPEIMAFMRALYGLTNLKVRQSWGGGAVHHSIVTRSIMGVVNKYQGDILREISTQGDKKGNRVINEKVVRAVAQQGRGMTREAMIGRAIVSANEAVARLVVAEAKGDEVGKSNMYQLISNAGSLIRHTLDVHKEELKKREQINTIVLDLVLDITKIDKIPGIETIVRRIPTLKKLLKNNVIDMMKAGAKKGNPNWQAYRISAKFEETVLKLGPSGDLTKLGKLLSANSESIAINRFKSGMSVK